MKSFQAKVGWKMMGKRENKKLSFRFIPTRCIIENSKKIKKIKKYHCGFISSQNMLEKFEKERNKNFRFVSVLPDAQKKIPKKLKKLKNTIADSFQAKIGWKKMRKRETKIIVPFCYVPARCVIENSIKIVKN